MSSPGPTTAGTTTRASRLRWSIGLWLLLRLISFPVALFAFYIRPRFNGIIAFTSIREFLLSPWYTWDAYYYVEIVRNGYEAGKATANFHPLYPWLANVVAVVAGDPLFSLLVVSSVAGLLLTIAFYRLAALDCDEQQSWQATALLLAWPASVALFAPYTEPLFLLLSVCCLFAARRNRFWVAGVAGALATLTRQQGLFLSVPLAWEAWSCKSVSPAAAQRRSEIDVAPWRRRVGNVLSVVLIFAAYMAWILYRWLIIHDLNPDFSSVQKFIYSVMISPSTFKILEHQQFLLPWTALWKALTIYARGTVHTGAYIDAALGVVFIGLFALSWRYLRTSYRIYAVVIILISLSFHTGDINPYMSLPRHLMLAFPVFIGVALRPRLKYFGVVLALFIVCQIALLCAFVWQTWVL